MHASNDSLFSDLSLRGKKPKGNTLDFNKSSSKEWPNNNFAFNIVTNTDQTTQSYIIAGKWH